MSVIGINENFFIGFFDVYIFAYARALSRFKIEYGFVFTLISVLSSTLYSIILS